MPKKIGGFVDFNTGDPDPAVAALLSSGARAQAERALPKRERQKKAKQRQKDAGREGKRALYDLPPEIIQEIAALADKHSCTASGVAALTLRRLLDDITTGRLQISEYLEPIQSPRYSNRVKLSKVWR